MKKSTIHAISLFATIVVTGTFGVANFSGELGNAFAMSHLSGQNTSMGTDMQRGNTSGGASNMTSMGSNMTSGNVTGNMTSGGNTTAPHAANMTADKASASNASLSS